MTDPHLSDEDVALYVMGAHDQITRSDVEGHLARCEDCAARLHREARLEDALYEVAEATRPCPGCVRPGRERQCEACGAARRAGECVTEAVVALTARGRIYRGLDGAGRPVRIEELVIGDLPDMDTWSRFEKEARLLRELDHPGIPKFLGAFHDGDGPNLRFYVVQAWIEGEPLEAWLANHRVQEADVRDVAERGLEILVYLQSLSPRVFHRDVSPKNLIRAEDGSVVLTGFAAARDLGVTSHLTIVGSPELAPPEQMVGVTDETTDVYGLAATLTVMATRRTPVYDADPLARANLSEALCGWIRRAMSARPEDRFPDAEAALAALEDPEVMVTWRRPTRLRWVGVLAGVGFATAAAAAGIYLVEGRPDRAALPPKPPSAVPAAVVEDAGRPAPILTASAAAERGRPARDSEGSTVTKVGPARTARRSPPPAVRSAARTSTSPPAEARKDSEACLPTAGVPMGYVTIATQPWSTIYWDGKSLGDTPISRARVPSGCLEIEAVAEDGRRRRVRITAEPNQVRIYSFRL